MHKSYACTNYECVEICYPVVTSPHRSAQALVSCHYNDRFWLQVEHEKLKAYHFATDRDSERTAWVDALTKAATLLDDNDNARLMMHR